MVMSINIHFYHYEQLCNRLFNYTKRMNIEKFKKRPETQKPH